MKKKYLLLVIIAMVLLPIVVFGAPSLPGTVTVDELKIASKPLSIIDIIFFGWIRHIVAAATFGFGALQLRGNIIMGMLGIISSILLTFLPQIVSELSSLGGAASQGIGIF